MFPKRYHLNLKQVSFLLLIQVDLKSLFDFSSCLLGNIVSLEDEASDKENLLLDL